MLYPSIDQLIIKIGSKYSLVVAAAKRARLLRDGAKADIRNRHSNKYVGIALEEIYHDHIQFETIHNKDSEPEKR